jgi:hypothetical protein
MTNQTPKQKEQRLLDIEIDGKELFERLVRLEAKLDTLFDKQLNGSKKLESFIFWAMLLIGIGIVLDVSILARLIWG